MQTYNWVPLVCCRPNRGQDYKYTLIKCCPIKATHLLPKQTKQQQKDVKTGRKIQKHTKKHQKNKKTHTHTETRNRRKLTNNKINNNNNKQNNKTGTSDMSVRHDTLYKITIW